MKKVLVFGTARSGTNLFLDLVNQHPDVNMVGEILSHTVETDDPVQTVKSQEMQARKPVFGFKLLTYQLEARFENPAAFIDYLVSDGYRIINIRRANVLHLAISRLNAEAKKQYHYYPKKGEDKRQVRITIDTKLLLRDIRRMSKFHILEDEVLKSKHYLRIDYEEDLESAERHQAMMDKVCAFLDLKPVHVKASLEKSIPYQIQDYVLNYDEVKEALKNTRFRKFLPEEDSM